MTVLLKLLLPFLGPIITGFIDGYKAKLQSDNNTDKIAADLAARDLELQAREREINVQQNIADNGRWWTTAPRAIVCWSFAIFIAKCVVWDKVLGWGTTDPLRGDVGQWAQVVITMWFGGRTLEKISDRLARTLGRR